MLWAVFCPSSGVQDCVFTACGIMQPRCCWPVFWNTEALTIVFGVKDIARLQSSNILHTEHTVSSSVFQATSRQHLGCIIPHAVKTESCAPEDEQKTAVEQHPSHRTHGQCLRILGHRPATPWVHYTTCCKNTVLRS